jgi:hypothetical protein
VRWLRSVGFRPSSKTSTAETQSGVRNGPDFDRVLVQQSQSGLWNSTGWCSSAGLTRQFGPTKSEADQEDPPRNHVASWLPYLRNTSARYALTSALTTPGSTSRTRL